MDDTFVSGVSCLDVADDSAECERERLDACVEEFDDERSIDDGLRLSNQPIEPLPGRRSATAV
jgi:hypothetical protein